MQKPKNIEWLMWKHSNDTLVGDLSGVLNSMKQITDKQFKDSLQIVIIKIVITILIMLILTVLFTFVG